MPAWPTAPRRVPFRVAAQSAGALGLVGALLLVMALTTGVAEWGRDDFRSPRVDWRLDEVEPKGLAAGTIESVMRFYGKNKTPRDYVLATYRFEDANGAQHRGRSWIATGTVREDAHHGVEYVPEDPSASRLREGKAAYLAHWLEWYAGLVVLPLVALLALWFAHVFKVRALLRQGRAVEAVVVEVHCPEPARRRRRRNAQRCKIRYRYRGPDGQEREGTRRPLLQSALGRALADARVGEPLAGAFVVVSEWSPTHQRLVATGEVEEDRS